MTRSTEEIIRLAEAAERLNADPAWQAATESAEASIIEGWRHAESAEEREAWWHRLQALEAVKRELRVLIGARPFDRRKT